MEAQSVGIRDLKQNASAVVARVKAGETIVVTERGVPVAMLVPAGELRLEDLVQAGLATAPTRSLSDMLAAVPEGPPTTLLSDILRDMRSDERS